MYKALKQRKGLMLLTAALICLVSTVTVNADLSTDRTLYTVANAHLDTQWNWTIQTTINSYITKTVDDNESLFNSYPNYNFNFEGAFKYALIKEYWPARWTTMSNRIAQGRWFVAGSAWDANDVNIPSAEDNFRNILYGNGFFKQEFGKSSVDIMLPDCFGFGYALPAIAKHAGLKGFHTQKLSWGSAYGTPFDIGRWIGVDGSYICAAIKPGSYVSSFSGDLSNNSSWLNTINANGAYGVYAGYGYHGTGDTGGAPSSGSASSVNTSVNGAGPINVLSAPADQLFKDITPSQLLGLPSYNGELVMTTHGTGCYTSRTINKRWHRKNELLADGAERASVMANWLGGATYPLQRLSEAWKRFIWHGFHDDLTGTSVYTAYVFSHNDYVISLNQFAGELANSVGAVTRAMDTQATGTPIVVYNPLALARKDVVEARVYFPSGVPTAIRVYDPSGAEVPSQMGAVQGNYATVIFLADMPSLSYETYDVRSSASPCSIATGLSATSTSLSSNRYTVTVNASGDISSIIDKANSNRELLSGASRLQMQNDNSSSWPSWEVLWSDVNSTPREYVSGSVSTSIVENGPARVALKVTRTQAGSNFTQIIRLNAGGDADRVEIDNDVNWQTQNTLLKATFPLSTSNSQATYDLGLGTIRRNNNTSTLYEVPAQQWADITNSSNDYGVSIMNDCKYGWDKPSNNTLRLTLQHNPNTDYGSNGQKRQDLGKNIYQYAIYGHAGNWTTGGTVEQAARLNQPLLAFQAPSHTGTLGKSYSFLSVNNPQVLVKAVKKAEASNEVIVRLQETRGASVSNALLTCGSGISSAREVNAQEDAVGSATVTGGQLQFSLTAYQPKTFALTLSNPPTSLTAPASQAVSLTYNKDVVSPDTSRGDGNFDGTNAIPAELFPASVTCESIQFTMGPTTNGQSNALTAGGQNITLNNSAGYKRLYFLAGSASGDLNSTFTMDGTPVNLTIQDMKANVGQWDLQSNTGPYLAINIKRAPVAWVATHIHTSTANTAYKFANLFKYRIDLPTGVTNPVLTLPNNTNILIFAMTMSNNSNDDTAPACYLYDYLDPGVLPTPTPSPTPDPNNVAYNKTATANQYVAGEDPFKAVDGTVENNSKWCSNVSGDKWLRLDLGQSYTIIRWVVKHAGAGGESTTWNTSDFKLQKSTDGTTFTDVDSVVGNTANITDRNVTAFTNRYVRLYITKPTSTTDVAARIYEFELYIAGGATATPTSTPTPTPTATPVGPTATPTPSPIPGGGTGLQGEYFDNMDLTNLILTRTDATVNFNWGTGTPDPTIGADTFSVRWTGQVQAKYSETYTFYTTTDDGVRLWVNNQLLIDKWVDQSATEWSGTIALSAGQKYDIKMEFYDNGVDAVAMLSWSSASQVKEIIPQSQLYPPSGATPTPTPTATVGPTATPTPTPSSIMVNLSSYYNQDGFSYDTNRTNGAYDPGASPTSCYSADLLNSNPTFEGVSYTLGPKTDGSNNAIYGAGQTIALNQGQYTTIRFLGSATNGDKTGTFRINYTDATYTDVGVTERDWCGSTSGQKVVQTMAHRHQGSNDQTINTSVFAYYLTPTAGKTVASLVLPNDANVHVLAITLAP